MQGIHTVDLGNVLGKNGISPVVEILTDTFTEYRLRVTWYNEARQAQTFLTPNLRGTTTRIARVNITQTNAVRVIPMSDLGLDSSRDWFFGVYPAAPFPLFRNAVAVRQNSAVHISVFFDTSPYTTPKLGSPFPGGEIRAGDAGLLVGGFNVGARHNDQHFPVILVCFEGGAFGTGIPVFL